MKAIVYRSYGSPEVLEYSDIDQPVPADDAVLLKIHSASLNPLDYHLMRGDPFIIRMMAGLRRPKDIRAGKDVAGTIEAVGKRVADLKPGDEVFGSCEGAFAEYAVAPVSSLVTKPPGLSFEQAACVNVAGITALQGLRDKGRLRPGQKVLVNGASGGVGTFGVQIAKSFDAEVTGVCSTKNLELVRSIGADRVIDYTVEDFTQSGQRYDVILDCWATHPLSALKRALSPRGIHVGVGGPMGSTLSIFADLAKSLLVSSLGSQKFATVLASPNKNDLTILRDLIESGKVTPVIGRRFSLSEVPEAMRYLEEGHPRGKVIINLAA